MPITLEAALAPERRYTVHPLPGEPVTFVFAPLSYPAERGRAAATGYQPGEFPEAGGVAAELAYARLLARQLDADVEIYARGWEGVLTPEGAPAPLTPESWRAFRDTFWQAAEDLRAQIAADRQALAAAGNRSAPLPSTLTA